MDSTTAGEAFILVALWGACGSLVGYFLIRLIIFIFKFLKESKTHYDRPQPAYGPAQAHRIQRRYNEAIAYLGQLCASYPDLAGPFIHMMDIYATDFHDYNTTRQIYERAQLTVTSAEEMKKLTDAYHEFMIDAPSI